MQTIHWGNFILIAADLLMAFNANDILICIVDDIQEFYSQFLHSLNFSHQGNFTLIKCRLVNN